MIENKHYSWREVESYLNKKISEKEYYSNPLSSKAPFTIIMPPPNVTGYLHMGHALVTTLQDILVRYNRMKGFDVLWQSGIDHAGIATQAIVEKQLAEKNIKRQDLSRETFIEKVYEWKEHSSGKIIDQIKKMGASADFSYLAFTMDAQSIRGVNYAFIKLYEAGLIYQDDRLVNWDCKLQTAISDLEVENRETKGKLYYLRYYFPNSDKYLSAATTRPETIFGDTALAVNPKDDRFKDFIGFDVVIPFVNRRIKIISDDYADMTKGSGVVKITPAHDFNDFEVGKRNNLESINILNKDGTLNDLVPASFIGLEVTKARVQLLKELETLDLIEKIEDHIMTVPYGDRSNTVIEPLLTKQWFLNAKELAKEAIDVVKTGKLQFVPNSWENLYFDWMKNVQPWCISRQLWWGHRIPVYYAPNYEASNGKCNGETFVAETLKEAKKKAFEYFGCDIDLTQDNDVLDTWFSSSLWPFLTLGWPESTEKLKKYYPSDVLVTAFDIIFFWVARMVMMGTFFMKEIPFKKVYIHALIRDDKGNKMSKSKGNVIDPLDVIEKYGTDALRFALTTYSGQGRDINLSEKTIEGYRNFVTKIWNSYKFCSQNGFVFSEDFNPNKINLDINKWILFKIENLQKDLEKAFNTYRFNDIANSIYQFVWGHYCDWYLELSKPILYSEDFSEEIKKEIRETMGFIFDGLLKLMHPIMPYISQYLFENLHNNKQILLCKESFPQYNFSYKKQDVSNTEQIVDLVSKIRSIRVDLNISPAVFLNLKIERNSLPDYIHKNVDIIKKIARLESISLEEKIQDDCIQDVVNSVIFGISLEGIINIQAEIIRLEKSKTKIISEIEKIDLKLNNKQFIEKANPQVIESFRNQKIELESQIEKLSAILNKITKQ